ncbi:hypothetical protein VTN00DRAFT_9047 [Thermoascus crustaceus]|uniref:uncharacterized protein n=1 Tax=Thermoascus crustaceus TaxID=5088 RepID=UPI0037438D82
MARLMKANKGVRCKKEACCGGFFGGDEGTCGFGPNFCGNDCDSQCDAKPECGQYAANPGQKCPLNVCCSSYGYCGTTSEFCGTGCQSNCEEHPAPPKGGSAVSVLDNKVIGYYQSWADRRSCRSFPPNAIPVEGLTHLNFAFAYIDPDSLDITVMDDQTPEGLFARTTDIKNTKSRNSELEVFVSIGGWTFSDNGTATQPLFSKIAADEGKRAKFADNVLSFMVRYGFDGVDLDWEYPGAEDRGGNEDDVKNYVALLKTMREKFESSARVNYGLTFTIPTSYWYLRWFDVPGLLKYADWVNMMSYDLHGVWDQNNPIGSKVHPHTNLTEIKEAAELLWRNDVPPAKVVLGVGFYGRSFHLEDKACTTPGCAFKGDAEQGDCTKSSGTLAYFEIQDIIKKQNTNVTYDNEAAVNWITYGDNLDNWVSYDDSRTLSQKVKYANAAGMGGVMIWSVDQDDDSFTALEGLIGKSLPSYKDNMKRTHTADTNYWKSLNGQSCKLEGLAAKIVAEVATVTEILEARGAPAPSFAESSAVGVGAAHDLLRLSQGPVEHIVTLAYGAVDTANLATVARFEIPQKVPLGSTISLADLAVATGLDEDVLARAVRYAIANGNLHGARARPIAVGLADVLKAQQEKQPNAPEAAFNASYPGYVNLFDYMGKNPDASQGYFNYLDGRSQLPRYTVGNVVRSWDWASAAPRATPALLSHATFRTPNLSSRTSMWRDSNMGREIVAQDPDLQQRVTFTEHDFFQPRPVQADVYFFRHVLHDWSDADCVRILQALLPALKDAPESWSRGV